MLSIPGSLRVWVGLRKAIRAMKRIFITTFAITLSVAVGQMGVAGPPPYTNDNGNANGDSARDLSDATARGVRPETEQKVVERVSILIQQLA